MTVGELIEKMSAVDPQTPVIASYEAETSTKLFEIEDASVRSGKPSRDSHELPIFKFQQDGHVSWLFLILEEG